MTHIHEARVIGNHADMGAAMPAAPPAPKTATQTVREGMRHSGVRPEKTADPATEDNNGGQDG